MEKDYKDGNRNEFRPDRNSYKSNYGGERGERRARPSYDDRRGQMNRFGESPERRENRRDEPRERKSLNRSTDYRERTPRFQGNSGEQENRPRRPFQGDRPASPYRSQGERPYREDRPYRANRPYGREDRRTERPYNERGNNDSYGERQERSFNRDSRPYGENLRRREPRQDGEYKPRTFRPRPELSGEQKEELRQKHYSKKKILAHRQKQATSEDAELRLNRYISMGGICSRRDADELIKSGRVKVNGEVVLTVGVKVKRKDRIEVDDTVVVPERKVYIVLNKPKDYVTTVDDPLERKTVMTLVEDACKERVYPVGRLDRQTTGVLLFTNDGDLAKKLTHPKYDHKKIYHVFLDKPLKEEHLKAIGEGVELEDGFIKADDIDYASSDYMEVGIEIHSGKNRIVRRIFEHFGYQIIKLDRVYFAGITKKNIPRGKWRFLTSQEINMLKVY